MSTAAEKRQETAGAIEGLRVDFPKGSTVHTIIRHVSRSGMSRSITVLAHGPLGISDVSWWVARALGSKLDTVNGGVKVQGAGMDMGFHLVYSLSQVLYGSQNGYDLNHRGL